MTELARILEVRARAHVRGSQGDPHAMFRCEKLACVLSERACGGRHARAEAIRPGHVLRHEQIGLVECRGCELGALHEGRHGAIAPRPIVREKRKRRDDGEVARVAQKLDERKPKPRPAARARCKGCGGIKSPGAGRKYCGACRATRACALAEDLRARRRAWRRVQLGTALEAQRTGRCTFQVGDEPCGAETPGPWSLYCTEHAREVKRQRDREYAARRRARAREERRG